MNTYMFLNSVVGVQFRGEWDEESGPMSAKTAQFGDK